MLESQNRSARSPLLRMSRGPAVGWIALVFGGTLILQSVSELRIVPLLFFVGLSLLFASLIWHADTLTNRRPWLYLTFQSLLVNGSALLMPDGSPILLAALNPVIISQSYAIYPDKRKFFASFALNALLFGATTMAVTETPHHGALFVAWFIPMCVVLLGITNLAVRQLQTQFRTQSFLTELEIAHQQVEELTIANERQRMARDLHDTLAQGLAGIVMQLEAIDANLSKNRSERAREIVRQAMDRARRTLAEAREAIDDLRSLSKPKLDFAQAVKEEADRFRQETGMQVQLDIQAPSPLTHILAEHGLHIVRECLANAAKHSEATKVWILIYKADRSLAIEFRDDGQGFNTALIGKSLGHYGLVGIQERVRIIGGSFEIDSGSEGTSIRILAPLPEGD